MINIDLEKFNTYYNEIVDNKINNAMEKIKNDNENMWIKNVLMKDKVTDPK